MAFEYLAPYATFESVADMDKSVEDHMRVHRLDLTTSERAIVFMIAGRSLMYPGASHLKAETIAEKTKTSRSTVMRGIKKLIALKIIEKVNQKKLNGIMGANVYKILPFDETARIEQRAVVVEPSYDIASEPVFEDLSIKSFNLLSSKQAKNIMYLENDLALQAEKKKEYMNEYQTMLFDFLHSLPFVDELKDQIHKIVLSTEMNTREALHKAKDVFMNIAMDINNGTLTVASTLRAVFKGAYDKAIKREVVPSASATTVEDKERTVVPLYNWLNERENDVTPNNYRPIENWLDW